MQTGSSNTKAKLESADKQHICLEAKSMTKSYHTLSVQFRSAADIQPIVHLGMAGNSKDSLQLLQFG